MAWIPITQGSQRSRVLVDSENPNRFSEDATFATLHYESEIGSGIYNLPVDLIPDSVNNAQLDGWVINSNGWHYALGIDKQNHPGEDGWFGFGGRKGQNWLKFRLERVGYLRWNNRTWTDLGGLPTYSRAEITQQPRFITFPSDGVSQVVENIAEWRNLYSTPGGGEVWLEIQADGDKLKVNPVIDQAGRDYIASQYPGTPQSQTYFAFAFRLDVSDVPKWMKNGIVQEPTGDFDDDDGSTEIYGRDALDRLLFFLPLDDAIVRDPATGEELGRLRLRKRIYLDNGNVWLLVGARVDLLNALPNGELIFDPTINAQISAGANDGQESSSGDYSNDFSNERIGQAAGRTWHIWQVFTGLSIGQGDTVDTSYVEMEAVSNDNTVGTHDIYGIDEDTSVAPTSDTDWQTDEGLHTTASVAWQPGGGSGVTGGTRYQSPEIKTIVQEIVDRAGFANNIQLHQDGRSGESDTSWKMYENSPTESALLHIEYTAGGGATVACSAGVVASSGQGASVVPGGVSVPVSLGTFASQGVGAQISVGGVTIAVLTGILQSSGQTAGILPGEALVLCNVGALSILGQGASVVPGEISVSVNVGVIASSGHASTIQIGATNISVSVGVIASSGLIASILPGGVSVSVQVGVIASSGHGAIILVDTIISVGVGVLASNGHAVTLQTGAVISVSLGLISSAGHASSIIGGAVFVVAQTAVIASSGHASSVVSGETVITVQTAVIASAGLSSSVIAGGVSVLASLGAISSAGHSANLISVVSVLASAGTISAAGVSASSRPGGVTVLASWGVISSAGHSAGISNIEGLTVACSPGTILAQGISANVLPGEISVPASVAVLSMAGIGATIISHEPRIVSASMAVLSAQGHGTVIVPGGVVISSGIGNIVFAGENATVYSILGIQITATIGQINFSSLQAVILLQAVIMKLWANASTSRATRAAIQTMLAEEGLVSDESTGNAEVSHE